MGRCHTGAQTTEQAVRIELSKLIRWGYFKKGCVVAGQLSWTNGEAIGIKTDYRGDCPALYLSYTITDSKTGQKIAYNYVVNLTKRASNLGKGEVLYFVCPESGQLCRILYKAYGYHKWKCREAYRTRIYYPLQLSSKKGIYNDKYWQIEHKLEAYKKGRKCNTYNGVETKKAAKIRAMINERNRMDALRWSDVAMPQSLQKFLNGRDIWECL
jgi:hypothetical protein